MFKTNIKLKARCFFCLKKCKKKNYQGCPSFQMLMRYLKINSGNFSSGRGGEDIVNLCGNCDSRMKEFWKTYQEFEVMRLNVDKCVEGLYSLMEERREGQGLSWGMDKTSKEPKSLREETITKCAQKIYRGLQVTLEKISTKENCASVVTERDTTPSPIITMDTCTWTIKNEIDEDTDNMEVAEYDDITNILTRPESPSSIPIIESVSNVVKTNKGSDPVPEPPEEENTLPVEMNTVNPIQSEESFNLETSFISDIIEEYNTDIKLEPNTLPVYTNLNQEMYGVDCEPPELLLPNELIKVEILPFSPVRINPQELRTTPVKPNPNLTLETITFSCSICWETFKNRGAYLSHKKTLHAPPPPKATRIKRKYRGERVIHKCNFCEYTTRNIQSNWVHMVRRHIIQLYSNRIPPGVKEPLIQAVTVSLVEKHTKYPSGKIGCPYCTQFCHSISALKLHIQDKHFDRVLIALENSHDVTLESLQLQHKLKVTRIQKPKPDRVCSLCNRKFTALANLEKHMKICNSLDENFSCENCDKSFKTLQYLQNHLIVRHPVTALGQRLPPNTSEQEMEATIQSFLKGTALGSNKHQCPICQLEKTELKSHLFKCHLDKLIEKLDQVRQSWSSWATNECPTCRIRFSSREFLISHEKTHKVAKVKCHYCNYSKIRGNQGLRYHHLLKHTYQVRQNKLPPGTTEEMVKDAVNEVFRHRLKFPEGNKRVGCLHCEKRFVNWLTWKMHVLVKHFNLVVAQIQKSNGK